MDSGELVFASGGIVFSPGRVATDDEAPALVAVEADLPDTQVVAHVLVVTLARRRRVGTAGAPQGQF
ncbi:hypothetical protein ACFSL4_17465 [Streptomyces caeni]|uniref:Uncharacterized protein n=1 Tax=Streptomyces caeni TaxID=2307231 RepID=A0ABW4IVD9_9ACTN